MLALPSLYVQKIVFTMDSKSGPELVTLLFRGVLPSVRFTLWLFAGFCFLSNHPMVDALVISEIMYHPVDAHEAPADGDEYEFVELHNTTAFPVDLSGAYFSKGIRFKFSKGTVVKATARVLVVKNLVSFTKRYSPSLPVVGVYDGSLSNNGEQLILKDRSHQLLCAVRYDEARAWPQKADGFGSSLVLKAPDTDASLATSWCASDTWLGSPGQAGSCELQEVCINEILTHTDYPQEDGIELYNRSDKTVILNEWYLSDELADLKKYPIPQTRLPSRSFMVIYEQAFNTKTKIGQTPFAFSSSLGETLFLTESDPLTGHIKRCVDYVAFDPAENGVSFGRYPDGEDTWGTLSQITFGSTVQTNDAKEKIVDFRSGKGAANSPYRVGPIVINEIMYHADLEYIELYNTSNRDVPLYDPNNPSNTWKVTTAVDYVFPLGVVLKAHGYLLLVNTLDRKYLQWDSPLHEQRQLLGPWIGELSNAGESIRLLKPDPPEKDFTPYILVERVDYQDRSPWPAQADGQGYSLERIEGLKQSNNPHNWSAFSKGGTPGTKNRASFKNQ